MEQQQQQTGKKSQQQAGKKSQGITERERERALSKPEMDTPTATDGAPRAPRASVEPDDTGIAQVRAKFSTESVREAEELLPKMNIVALEKLKGFLRTKADSVGRDLKILTRKEEKLLQGQQTLEAELAKFVGRKKRISEALTRMRENLCKIPGFNCKTFELRGQAVVRDVVRDQWLMKGEMLETMEGLIRSGIREDSELAEDLAANEAEWRALMAEYCYTEELLVADRRKAGSPSRMFTGRLAINEDQGGRPWFGRLTAQRFGKRLVENKKPLRVLVFGSPDGSVNTGESRLKDLRTQSANYSKLAAKLERKVRESPQESKHDRRNRLNRHKINSAGLRDRVAAPVSEHHTEAAVEEQILCFLDYMRNTEREMEAIRDTVSQVQAFDDIRQHALQLLMENGGIPGRHGIDHAVWEEIVRSSLKLSRVELEEKMRDLRDMTEFRRAALVQQMEENEAFVRERGQSVFPPKRPRTAMEFDGDGGRGDGQTELESFNMMQASRY
ncbi:hypothetical protein BV898_02531 [Hypsibius exemplaris]|uniref:Uncharacterized protein n=1 Tax=Hypsibius exemplaris TaxID=2072580 RepID=A0A1W0X790_HYPEX|nr:hypothetical protein BV898_02531 [Hypsibius exemplaris]